jgi:REP element-mobilizing transposase RayT
VTFVTAERQPFFTQTKLAELATNEVQRIASANSFTVLAHCVMPDHVHVLIAGDSETSSLSSFAHRFKQSLGFKFKQETGNNLWQRSYHDHVLRTDEPWLPHAEYILNNPVRAGLVHTAQDWPYSGPRDAFRENGQV